MTLSAALIYLAIGSLAGTLAGLLGIGGGIIIVPCLLFLFNRLGFSDEVLTHLAVGTSLATIIFTSVSSVRTHHLKQMVDWRLVAKIAIGIIIGAQLGALMADKIDGAWLEFILGLFAIAVSLQMILQKAPKSKPRTLPGTAGISGAGTVIGAASSLVGIGGGSLSVPFFLWCNMSIQKAVGSSAAIGLIIAVSGTLGFVLNGWEEPGLPQHSLGYVYLPAVFVIICSSMLFAMLGARLSHRIPTAQLKRAFAVFLFLVGGRIMLSSGILY